MPDPNNKPVMRGETACQGMGAPCMAKPTLSPGTQQSTVRNAQFPGGALTPQTPGMGGGTGGLPLHNGDQNDGATSPGYSQPGSLA